MAKQPKLGSGKRFENLVDDLKSKGKSEDAAKGIAANAGREKYGDKKMEKLAKTGAKRAAK